MKNFNPMFNPLNTSRSLSPFATAGSSFATNTARTTGLFYRTGASKLTLSSILNGAQKTIGTVNQVVPLYNQIKPMFQNSKVLLNVAKELRGNNNSRWRTPRSKTPPIDMTQKSESSHISEEKAAKNEPAKPFFL